MLRFSRPLTALCLLAAAAAHSQTTEPAASPNDDAPLGLSPDDASALLGQLQRLQEDVSNNRQTLLNSAKTRIQAAATSESSAADLYLAAYKIVNIDRNGNADPANTEWRDTQIEWMKETGAPKAIRLQLAWLSLLIEAAQVDEEKRAAMLPKARSLAQEAVAAAAQLTVVPEAAGGGGRGPGGPGGGPGFGRGRERMGSRTPDAGQFLTQSVMNSLFAQAYNLRSHLELPRDWAMAPLDLDALYDRMLLPQARANKPSDLPALWDERIKNEAGLRRASMSETEFAEWGQIQGRSLLWQKNLDLLRNGVGGRAAGEELIKLYKENPNHPNLGTWERDLAQITSAITGS